MSIVPGTSPVVNDSGLSKSSDVLCPPNIFVPGVLPYLSFKDLLSVAAVSSDWRKAVFERADPRVFAVHVETAMRRHQRKYGPRINDLDAEGRDSMSRKWSRRATQCLVKALHMNPRSMYLVRILHESERRCVEVGEAGCYSAFLAKTIPVARAQNELCWLVPEVVNTVVDAYKDKVSVSFGWSREASQAEVARFLFCAATALAMDFEEPEFVLTMAQHRERHGEPLKLRLYLEKKCDFGVYMDPIGNTIHVTSMDIRFLGEQIRNASRSLSRFNGVCGFCQTVEEVEEHGRRLLQVARIVRDPGMSDSEHAHCLFKLILYSKDLHSGLRDVIIQPARSFGTLTMDNKMVVKLLWSASWAGGRNVHRGVLDADSSDDEDILSDLDLAAVEE